MFFLKSKQTRTTPPHWRGDPSCPGVTEKGAGTQSAEGGGLTVGVSESTFRLRGPSLRLLPPWLRPPPRPGTPKLLRRMPASSPREVKKRAQLTGCPSYLGRPAPKPVPYEHVLSPSPEPGPGSLGRVDTGGLPTDPGPSASGTASSLPPSVLPSILPSVLPSLPPWTHTARARPSAAPEIHKERVPMSTGLALGSMPSSGGCGQ